MRQYRRLDARRAPGGGEEAAAKTGEDDERREEARMGAGFEGETHSDEEPGQRRPKGRLPLRREINQRPRAGRDRAPEKGSAQSGLSFEREAQGATQSKRQKRKIRKPAQSRRARGFPNQDAQKKRLPDEWDEKD